MTNETTQPTNVGSNDQLGVMALAVLRAIADRAAAGNSTTIAHDWGFGSATLVDETGAHTHVGGDWFEDDAAAFEAFVSGLHSSLCGGGGLSWVIPNAEAQAPARQGRSPGAPS